MNFTPLLMGVWATLLAVLQTAGWMAIGFRFVSEEVEVETAAPIAILIGSGITSAIYAACAGAGHLGVSIALDVLLCAIGLGFYWRRVGLAFAWAGRSIAA